MSILKKVKKFFGFNSGEDEPNYPIVETQKASNGSKRGESKEESIIKTPIQEVNEAIEKYKKLIREELDLQKKSNEIYEKLVYSKVKYPLKKGRNVGKLFLELIRDDYLPQMVDIIEDLYEEDESILEKSNEDTTIEKIKKKSTKESIITIEQSIKEEIFKLLESRDIDLDSETTIDELVDSFIISMFKEFKSLYKIQSEIVPEKMGIRYALIRALNPDVVLPKKINGIYEDAEDYKKKEKASIIHNLTECIKNTTARIRCLSPRKATCSSGTACRKQHRIRCGPLSRRTTFSSPSPSARSWWKTAFLLPATGTPPVRLTGAIPERASDRRIICITSTCL